MPLALERIARGGGWAGGGDRLWAARTDIGGCPVGRAVPLWVQEKKLFMKGGAEEAAMVSRRSGMAKSSSSRVVAEVGCYGVAVVRVTELEALKESPTHG